MNTSETPKETIIYGGAFNPPTRAHQAILQACVDYAHDHDADVWLLPSGDRKDKHIEATRTERLRMVQALISDIALQDVSLSVDTRELDREVQVETYDTVVELNEAFPDRRFIWVFGSDSIETMPSWKGGEWLRDTLPMLIVRRQGYPIRTLGAHAFLLPVETVMTSSTEVRQRLAAHESIEDLVPPSVLACLT